MQIYINFIILSTLIKINLSKDEILLAVNIQKSIGKDQEKIKKDQLGSNILNIKSFLNL